MSEYELQKKSNIAATTMMTNDMDRYEDKETGKSAYRKKGYYAVNDSKVVTAIMPNNTPSSLANLAVEFKIEKGIVDVLDFVSLQMTFLNSTGTTGQLAGAPFQVKTVEVIAQEGSMKIFEMNDQELYKQFFFLNQNEYEPTCSAYGMTTSYGHAATTVANNGTIILNLPILQFFRAVSLGMCGISNSLIVRFTFNSATLSTISATPFACSGLQLNIRGTKLKAPAKSQLISFYNDRYIPVAMAHLSIDRMPYTTNLTANQTLVIPLNGLRGLCQFLIFTVRLFTDIGTAAGQINYIRMTRWDIKDSKSDSLIGSYSRDINTQEIDYGYALANEAWNDSGFHIMSFTPKPREGMATGSRAGSKIFTGTETLHITTPSNLSSASYQIDIRGYMCTDLVSITGLLKSTKTGI